MVVQQSLKAKQDIDLGILNNRLSVDSLLYILRAAEKMAQVLRHNRQYINATQNIRRLIALLDNKSNFQLPSKWTREGLIESQRPSKTNQVLAMAVCGTPPVGEEPRGGTNEWIWSIEEITNNLPPLPKTYRRIVCARIVNPYPGLWLATSQGGEGIPLEACPFPCPTEFFPLVPGGDDMWRKDVMAMPRPVLSMVDVGETGIHVKGMVNLGILNIHLSADSLLCILQVAGEIAENAYDQLQYDAVSDDEYYDDEQELLGYINIVNDIRGHIRWQMEEDVAK